MTVIGINNSDGHLGAHFHHKLPDANELLRTQGELRVHLWPDWPIGVVPNIMHTAIDEFLQPLPREKLVDIRLANARGHTCQKPGG